jgi:hypothetical protein
MRILLVICAGGMILLTVLFLRRRQMSWSEYLAWGLLAVLLPFLGPFLVILSKPGLPRPGRPPAVTRRSGLRRQAPLKWVKERAQRFPTASRR